MTTYCEFNISSIIIECLHIFLQNIVANKWEGQGMISADGEYVEFSSVVALEGPVEDWLCVVGTINCGIY